MLTLFHAPFTRSSRLVWLLEELNADYDLRYVSIARMDRPGSGRDPANPHPDGKVPALVHDGALITECAAVALYLTDLHPASDFGAAVGTAQRGAYVTWLAWNAGELEPVLGERMFGGGDNPMAKARYDAAIARIEAALAKGPYLMGDRFTAVDVMVGATLGWARAHIGESAAIDAYLARIGQRPAGARANELDRQGMAEAA